ncbi:MAG: hypothetical protein AAGF93_21835 [Cyanobacteria bacterium P01_H01_bin.105]
MITVGQGYDIPSNGIDGFTFSGFTALDRDDSTAGNATEQILQIVAGVRENFGVAGEYGPLISVLISSQNE